MDNNMSYILVICVAAPIFSFLFVSEGKMRTCISFLLVGIFSCLFVSEVNGLIRNNIEMDMFYLTTSVTPVTEELVKSIPLFFYAAAISDRFENLLPNAFLLGIGFIAHIRANDRHSFLGIPGSCRKHRDCGYGRRFCSA